MVDALSVMTLRRRAEQQSVAGAAGVPPEGLAEAAHHRTRRRSLGNESGGARSRLIPANRPNG